VLWTPTGKFYGEPYSYEADLKYNRGYSRAAFSNE
jgi:hypothetical protein